MNQRIKAKISINRRHGGGDTSVCIAVECATSLVKFLEISMTPEDFWNAITGLSCISVDAEVSGLHLVGKKRERREEIVECELPSYSKAEREAIILEAAKQFNVDGWKASAYPALNTQGGHWLVQGTRNTYQCRVELVRWVDQEGGAE